MERGRSQKNFKETTPNPRWKWNPLGMLHKEFAETNKEFQEACTRVGLPPTVRQAAKWRYKKGKAYMEGRDHT